jgi:hypothetical protein
MSAASTQRIFSRNAANVSGAVEGAAATSAIAAAGEAAAVATPLPVRFTYDESGKARADMRRGRPSARVQYSVVQCTLAVQRTSVQRWQRAP